MSYGARRGGRKALGVEVVVSLRRNNVHSLGVGKYCVEHSRTADLDGFYGLELVPVQH